MRFIESGVQNSENSAYKNEYGFTYTVDETNFIIVEIAKAGSYMKMEMIVDDN